MNAAPQPGGASLAVRDGAVVASGGAGEEAATLSWPAELEVRINGIPVDGTRATVRATDTVDVDVPQKAPRTDYQVRVSRNRMEATLRVRETPGARRWLAEAPLAQELRLTVSEEVVACDPPDEMRAGEAMQEAQVAFGIDADAIAAALADPGSEHVIARGIERVDGEDGWLEMLVDFDSVQLSGIPVGTPLARKVPKVEGTPGRDVTGRELPVKPVKDARVRCGEGAHLDPVSGIVTALIDGAPTINDDGVILVNDELWLDNVGSATGDIDFCGSVHVRGSVFEGRTVVARHRVTVEGNVDRAKLHSGGHMEVHGSIMSSILRAGGDNAALAGIFDAIEQIPGQLADAATRARQLRDAAAQRGQQLPYALSLQVILEKLYRGAVNGLKEAADQLDHAGEQHAELAAEFREWHRKLSTAANIQLGAEDFSQIVGKLGALVDSTRELINSRANLTVHYMQASEAEATGVITVRGKGIYNSRLMAWSGLISERTESVVRGGSIVSHGPVEVGEIGSPGGATMHIQLGKGASLSAGFVYGGTLVTSPGGSHRFLADRSTCRIELTNGALDVSSLAA